MSYSALIQKDSPACFWSLDETSGYIARANGFIVNSYGLKQYDGSYSAPVNVSAFSSIFPMTYGGKSSIKINSGTISIPSLNKMSYTDCGNSSSIEFWIKVDTTSSTEQVFMYKGSSSSNAEVKISILNDYIIYTIGTSSRKQSVSVHIDSINKPLHIVAGYSKSEITLIVNGVQSNKKIYGYRNYFSSTYQNNDFVFRKPNEITNMQIDSIALYSYVLTRQQALRHFVYGCGYNIPTEFIDNNNGVSYNFSMDGHQDIKKHEYGGNNPWSITQSNNCVVYNNTLTIRPNPEPQIDFVDGYGKYLDVEQRFLNNGSYTFDTKSYLYISDASSILPTSDSGWVFKFNKSSTTPSKDETLFVFRSNETENYIEFVLNSSGIKAYMNDYTMPYQIGPTSFTNLSNTFYIGFYIVDQNNIDLIYLPSSGSATISRKIMKDSFLFDNTKLTIGSSDKISNDENQESISTIENYVSSQQLTKIVGIHKDNINLYGTFSNIEGQDFKHYYTVTPNYLEKRFNIRSFATAQIDIPLQSLASPNTTYVGASRLEFGHPLGSQNFTVSVLGQTVSNGITTNIFNVDETITDRTMTDKSWLNKQNIVSIQDGSNKVDLLTFNLTFNTDDLVYKPPVLDYFRLFSYPVVEEGSNKYLTCNASPGGNPAKIYYRNNEYAIAIPDLQEYPFFYNGYSNGLKIGSSYAKITQDYAFPSKMGHITSVTKGTTTILTIEDNNFTTSDTITISNVYNTDGSLNSNWNINNPLTILSVSGNNVTVQLNSSTFTNYPTDVNYQGNAKTPSGIQTVSFMLYVPSSTNNADIIKVGTSQMSLSTTTLTLSGTTIYVNGVAGSTIKKDCWNNICFVYSSPILINDTSPVDIIIGNVLGTYNFYIDQLMIFDKKFQASDITNLYNLFAGNVSNVIYGIGPQLIDNDDEKIIKQNTQLCYIFDSNSDVGYGKEIFDLLKDQTNDTNLFLQYIDSSKYDNVKVILSKVVKNNDQSIFVKDASNVKIGSALTIYGIETNYTVSSIIKDDIKLTPTSGLAKNNKVSTVLVFDSNSNFDKIDVGDKVVCSTKGLSSKAIVQKVDANNKKITISCGKGSILTQNLSEKSLIFKKSSHKINLNQAVSLPPNILKLNIGNVLTFDNLSKKSNIITNNKLKIGNKYIQQDDYFFINSTTKTLWKIASAVDTNTYNVSKSISVIFEKEDFVQNTIYMDNDDLNNSIINNNAFLYDGSAFKNVTGFGTDRVISYVVPIEKYDI